MSRAPQAPDLLCAALFKVRARVAGLLPAFWGTLVQGAWLRWVQQGQVCWLRLTLLDGALFGSFARQMLGVSEPEHQQETMPPLTLNGIPFGLLEIVVEERGGPGETSWSGWTSHAKLIAESQVRPVRRQVHLLASYAFYAGVGHKTAQGLGRVRRVEEDTPASQEAAGFRASQ
jgi:hypothetical protein